MPIMRHGMSNILTLNKYLVSFVKKILSSGSVNHTIQPIYYYKIFCMAGLSTGFT